MRNKSLITKVLLKLNISLYDPAILLLGIYSKEMQTYAYKKDLHGNVCGHFIDNCQKLYIQCVAIDNQLNKLSDIHTMEYYWATKSNEYVQQHSWISEVVCYVREVSHKVVHTVWFHLLTFWKDRATGIGSISREKELKGTFWGDKNAW